METVYALLITTLFTAWVWELKGEVETLRQGHPADGQIPQEGVGAHGSAVMERSRFEKKVDRADVLTTPRSRITRSENGVPTWVIE